MTGARLVPSARGGAVPAPAAASAIAPGSRGFVVVGVGASAGGLSPLQELLSRASPDAPAAFVVVTHQHPGHPSLLPELLQRATQLAVREAGDGDTIEPGVVYVAPPRATLALMNGALHHVPPPEHGATLRSIDAFFRSLAKECQDRAIGVILSGTGSDGTLGLAAIKDEGGKAKVDLKAAYYRAFPQNDPPADLNDEASTAAVEALSQQMIDALVARFGAAG